MDGDSDGFPGMSSSEIASDTEAAALAEQFSLTVRGSCHSHILCAIGVLLRGRVNSGSTVGLQQAPCTWPIGQGPTGQAQWWA